jgi:signal transduction histidine kinase
VLFNTEPAQDVTRTDGQIVRARAAGDPDDEVQALRRALEDETDRRRRAECGARIQSDAMQTALDLLVRETDIAGFFRVLVKTLVEESESHGCGVWLLDEAGTSCELWTAFAQGRFFTSASQEWSGFELPIASMAAHLVSYTPGWTEIVDYAGDDSRLPEPVRAFNREGAVGSLIVAPLLLSTRNLGWVALSGTGHETSCDRLWRVALTEAMARQCTLALQQSRLADRSREEERRQAVLEERNRIARDIHDTLAQGFAAILMQLQAAQRSASDLPPAVARSLDTAVDLARTHMIEARRSVSALRPQMAETDVAAALHRMTELARRATDVPIELSVDDVPAFPAGTEREIIAIAQESLTNAVRHARARRITVHASGVRGVGFRLSVADDGRGVARERRDVGFGMTSMRERAERIGASLTIVTAPRSGTQVVLAWEAPSFSIPGGADAR